MNICLITSSFPSRPNDIAQAPFLIDFIQGLKERGHRVFVFTQDRPGEKEEFLKDVTVKWFPWITSKEPLVQLNPFRPVDFLKILSLFLNGRRELPRFIRENRIDACLALWVLPAGYFANRAFRRMKTPYSVWSLGSDVYRFGKSFLLYRTMRRIIQGATTVFADGFDLSKQIEKRFRRNCVFLATTRTLSCSSDLLTRPPASLLPRDSVVMSLRGSETTEATSQDIGNEQIATLSSFARNDQNGMPAQISKEREERLKGETYRFLFVGRIEKIKGIDLLLQSTLYLKKEALNFHLTVVGSGSLEEWARGFMKDRDLEEYISWMGNVPDEALVFYYKSSDCVVIPSRSESIPLVFSEALRFHKDLIVTDVGDMGMLGRRYGVATVVVPEDVLALAESMKKSVQSRAEGKKSIDGHKREELARLFDIKTSVERFLADYE